MAPKGVIVPAPDVDSHEFWEGCARHELLVRRCQNCGSFRFPPDPGCPNCGSLDSRWVKVRGEGTVFTYTIVPYTTHPALQDRVPYNVIVVSLHDAADVHMVSTLVNCRHEDIYIGMPVKVVFQDVTESVTLPFFEPIREGSSNEPAFGLAQAIVR